MADPYKVLGLDADSDDTTIRRRYLELVKQFPPEHHPEKFTAIRAAYESLRDLTTRVRHRLFESGKNESLDALIEELECPKQRRRVSLQNLLMLIRKP
jgi:curved DNA-binding protein CbpA